MRIESDHGAPQSLRHLLYGLHPLISWLKEQGIDHQPFLKRAGVPLEALSQPEYTITPGQEIGFIQDVYQSQQFPELGLIMGPRYHLSSYGMLGLAAMTSGDLFHCYKVVFDNIVLTWTYFKVSLYTEKERAYLQMDPIRDLGGSVQYMIERDLSAAWFIANEALDKELPLLSVEFKHPETSYRKKYEEIFHCPVGFNAQYNRFGFETRWLEEPLAKSEPETSRIFAAQCEEIASSLTKEFSFTEHIRHLLLNSTQESPSLETIATRLNTTSRTVQRKLVAEKTSFQELVDDVRVNVSTEYLLTTKQSIEDIAERVGYSDAAAFSNAFKRWTGTSPSAYRKQGHQS
jgi:AraC-like DNA-binding protein